MNQIIYPILKPGDWVGLEHGALHNIILGDEASPELVIAYGYDTPEEFVFLTSQDLGEAEPQEIFDQASHNLECLEMNFFSPEELGNNILFNNESSFSSEAILSQQQMNKAHTLLGSSELLVSIPRRGCMMVTSRDSDISVLESFTYFHNDAWNDDSFGNAPITNLFFVVQDGQIVGALSGE